MWEDLVAWFQSPGGARVLQTAIVPAIAILVAGLLAAAIARSAVRATIRRAERVEATAAVAGLVAAARVTVDAEGDLVSRRRASRLRAEADVRVRLLPVPGAALAADWAAARMDAIQQQAADAPAAAELTELRDRLVEWVGKPSRAQRVFTAPSAPPRRTAPAERAPVVESAAAEPAPAEPVAAAPEPRPAEQAAAPVPADAPDHDRFLRPAGAPRASSAEVPAGPPAPGIEPEPELVGAASAPVPAPAADALPAWQRTRAVERLQQERGRTRGVEPPTSSDQDAPPLSTAPVQTPRTHRSEPASPAAAESEEAVRLEAHQQARHARPTEQAPAATGAVPAATPTPAPAWLDTYDDEAQVTQNLDLKTPPPVAASAVRDRGGQGEDLVPRS